MLFHRQIDNKHALVVELKGDENCLLNGIEDPILRIVKNLPNEDADLTKAIDLDVEPVILFRGRDKLALPMLRFYRQLCVEDGCTNFQLLSMDDMILKFEKFAEENKTKQPGCTLGK